MDYFLENYSEFSSADHANFNNYNINNAHFTVDDLLDFSNNDETMTDSFLDSLGGNSGNSSVVTAVESCNSSVSGGGDAGQCNGDVSFRGVSESSLFTGSELCVPYDDLAELEWLSTFAEESFSTNNDLRFIPTTATEICKITDTSSSITTTHSSTPPPPLRVPSQVSVPGKARSRRPRAAPCDWSSRLLPVTPKPEPKKRAPPPSSSVETSGRKCLHCASEKTPQWRTGPMGPKTLCNACGVRFKSGRLVPEYRPAASPTFVSARHSNSHRKVMELRRQKEQQQHNQQQQQMLGRHGSIFDGGDEFLIQRQCYRSEINGPDLGGHII